MLIKTKPSYTPRCPSCNSILEGVGFPLKESGRGRCPAGNCYFDFKVDVGKVKIVKDVNGNVSSEPSWKLSGKKH